jgi:hypothetical protein
MNKRLPYIVVLVVAGSLAACAPTMPLPTPTKTPVPLATPAPAPDLTEAVTSVPDTPGQPDLAAVVLTPADLPPGFQAASSETMSPVAEGFTQAPFFDVAGTSGFTMAHSEGPELIVTFSGTFTEDDPFREDAPATQKPLFAVYMFIFGAGTQEITGDGQLSGLEGIGQEALGYFGLANLNSQLLRVDLVVFRRARAGVYVFHMYPQSLTSAASVVALACLLDARLSAAVGDVQG